MSTSGSALNEQPSSQTTPAMVANVQPASTSIPTAPTPNDQLLFADQANIEGEALLDLATRYTTIDIARHVNAAAGKVAMSERKARWRVAAAIRNHAKSTGKTVSEVRGELTAARKSNGLRGRENVQGEASEYDSEADVADVAATANTTF